MTIYEVYQPHTSGPEGIHSAIMISRHRSPGPRAAPSDAQSPGSAGSRAWHSPGTTGPFGLVSSVGCAD